MVKSVSEIRQEEIIEAAHTALQKHGLSAISYDLIAEKAETSRQLVRHYYPDMESIMVDVLERISEDYRRLVFDTILSRKATERLSILLDFFLGDLAREGGPSSSLFDAMFALSTGSEVIRKKMKRIHELLADTFSTEINFSYPSLDQKACDELGYTFVCMLTGQWRIVSSIGFSDTYIRVASEAIDRIIQSHLNDVDDALGDSKDG